MKTKLIAMTAAAMLLCGCGASAGENESQTEQTKTLAEQMSAKLDAGEYDIKIKVSGSLYASEMSCHMWGRGGDGCVAMDDNGVYTEFCTVDNETYMLIPAVECYEIIDQSGGFGNTFIKLGEGDTLLSSDTKDGIVTEIYTGSSGEKEQYTFTFDEKSGELITFISEKESGTTVTEVESMSWKCDGVELPDLTEWHDIGENAMVDEVTQLKFSLYLAGGITEEDVTAAGYTYDEICRMELDERTKVTDKLLGE